MSADNERARMDYESRPECAIASLLHMLSRFPMTRCGAMAGSITEHFAYVAADPRFEEPIRRAAREAVGEWKAIAEMQACLARQQRAPG